MVLLDQAIQDWWLQLQHWAIHGRLLDASRLALRINTPEQESRLCQLNAQLADGDSSVLPAVELLDNSAMPAMAGAYGSTTGTIYLNKSWFRAASFAEHRAVLTEEFVIISTNTLA